jgi:adenylosuccinate synthase
MPGEPSAIIIADLGYGDGGKGSTADFLCHLLGITVVYRHTGGPNSVHHVVTDGWDLGVSSFASYQSPATWTQLGPDFILKPAQLLREADDIRRQLGFSPLSRLSIDPAAKLALPHHAIVGQMREVEAGANRRGSTGLGIGEVALDEAIDPSLVLTVSDCREPQILARKIRRIADLKISHAEDIVARTPSDMLRRFLQTLKAEPVPPDAVSSLTTLFRDLVSVVESRDFLTDAFRNGQSVLCEGAHGTLIDRDCGFPPYVTRRRTTAGTVRAMLDALDVHPRALTVGILRAIAFRHGPGPFVTQDDAAFAHIEERHNKANHWQGEPRHGWFDVVTARYAAGCNRQVDVIAATMLDQLALLPALYVSTGYLMPSRLADEGGAYLDTGPRDDASVHVRGIRPVCPQSPRLTALLAKCRPLLAPLARRDTGPPEGVLQDPLVRAFLDFVASPQGLGRPPGILSYGPRRADKIATAEFWKQC